MFCIDNVKSKSTREREPKKTARQRQWTDRKCEKIDLLKEKAVNKQVTQTQCRFFFSVKTHRIQFTNATHFKAIEWNSNSCVGNFQHNMWFYTIIARIIG